MNLFRLPDSLIEEIHSLLARFWWGAKEGERKIHWMSWDRLCLPKNQGGQGFRNLKVFNEALLAKQGWRIMTNPDSLLAKVLKAKYFRGRDFMDARLGQRCSFLWRSLWGAIKILKLGVASRIGNGASTSISEDKWIPTDKEYVKPSQHSCPSDFFSVSCLINYDSMTWDVDRIQNFFTPQDAVRILAIPLLSASACDSFVWAFTKDGAYSVKSGYRAGILQHSVRPSSTQSEVDFWAAIWNLNVPPKLKTFGWRALTESLSVKTNLVQRGVIQDATCTRCSSAAESVSHALIYCAAASPVWSNSSLKQPVNYSSADKFGVIAKYVLDTLGIEELKTFLIQAWAVWCDRNLQLFQQKPSTAESICVGFSNYVGEYIIQSASKSIVQPRAPVISAWTPPPLGKIKMNVDAHCHATDGASAGVVFRDGYGFVQAIAVKKFKHKWPSDVAEAMACRYGLQVAARLGLSSLILESDALSIVSRLKNPSQSLNYLGSILDNILFLASSFSYFGCNHVSRTGNTVAHYVARLDVGVSDDVVFVSDIPQGILTLAEMDI